jgi:hypothetical protein
MSNLNGGADSVPVASNIKNLNFKLKSYYHMSIPGISRFELNLIKGFVPLKINEWKSRNYHHIEMIRPEIIKVVAVKNPWIMKAYEDKLKIITKGQTDFTPVYSGNGNFDFMETFSLDKIAIHKQMQLKNPNDVRNIKCSCDKSFVLYSRYDSHKKQNGCVGNPDFN